MKKKLDELKLSLPDPASPLPSPTPDAPSPSSTPPADVDTQQDNIEAIDMELSDSDNDESDATRNILGNLASYFLVCFIRLVIFLYLFYNNICSYQVILKLSNFY